MDAIATDDVPPGVGARAARVPTPAPAHGDARVCEIGDVVVREHRALRVPHLHAGGARVFGGGAHDNAVHDR
eukprot:6329277-Prymnesium_polylepis.1